MVAKPSEKVAVVGAVDPDANATGEFATDWISIAKFQQVMFVVMTGILVTTTTVDFKVQEAKTATGGSGQDLATGTLSITQLDTDSNDSQVVVNVEAQDLSQNFDFVRGVMTLTLDAGDTAVLALGLLPRFAPASDNDLASVGEITG